MEWYPRGKSLVSRFVTSSGREPVTAALLMFVYITSLATIMPGNQPRNAPPNFTNQPRQIIRLRAPSLRLLIRLVSVQLLLVTQLLVDIDQVILTDGESSAQSQALPTTGRKSVSHTELRLSGSMTIYLSSLIWVVKALISPRYELKI